MNTDYSDKYLKRLLIFKAYELESPQHIWLEFNINTELYNKIGV